jgi:hypothetical protein
VLKYASQTPNELLDKQRYHAYKLALCNFARLQADPAVHAQTIEVSSDALAQHYNSTAGQRMPVRQFVLSDLRPSFLGSGNVAPLAKAVSLLPTEIRLAGDALSAIAEARSAAKGEGIHEPGSRPDVSIPPPLRDQVHDGKLMTDQLAIVSMFGATYSLTQGFKAYNHIGDDVDPYVTAEGLREVAATVPTKLAGVHSDTLDILINGDKKPFIKTDDGKIKTSSVVDAIENTPELRHFGPNDLASLHEQTFRCPALPAGLIRQSLQTIPEVVAAAEAKIARI